MGEYAAELWADTSSFPLNPSGWMCILFCNQHRYFQIIMFTSKRRKIQVSFGDLLTSLPIAYAYESSPVYCWITRPTNICFTGGISGFGHYLYPDQACKSSQSGDLWWKTNERRADFTLRSFTLPSGHTCSVIDLIYEHICGLKDFLIASHFPNNQWIDDNTGPTFYVIQNRNVHYGGGETFEASKYFYLWTFHVQGAGLCACVHNFFFNYFSWYVIIRLTCCSTVYWAMRYATMTGRHAGHLELCCGYHWAFISSALLNMSTGLSFTYLDQNPSRIIRKVLSQRLLQVYSSNCRLRRTYRRWLHKVGRSINKVLLKSRSSLW